MEIHGILGDPARMGQSGQNTVACHTDALRSPGVCGKSRHNLAHVALMVDHAY